MNSTGMQVAFYGLSAIVLVSALLAVSLRNIAHAAFALLPCFLGIAGLYAALDAHFFFVAQVLIYAGAILVLFVFALMLTRDLADPRVEQRNKLVYWAAAISVAAAAACGSIVSRLALPPTTETPPGAHDQVMLLGRALIGPYAVPFEVASLILLAAMMGAVVLASARRERTPTSDPAAVETTVTSDQEALV